MEINHKNLGVLLEKSFEVKKPLFIWGGTGIGKSVTSKDIFKKIAKENGRDFLEWNKISDKEKIELKDNDELRKKVFIFADVRMSQMDSTDFKGIPKLDAADYCEWKPPLLFRVLASDGCMAGVFMDEFNTAPPSVQASAMQLILDREIGELALAEDVFLIAAGNRGAEDKSATFDIPGPLLNRFGHCELQVPTAEDWTAWALKNGIDERIIGFINFAESHLWKWDPDNKDKAFSTPRRLNDLSAYIKDEKNLDLVRLYATANIGAGSATEFVKFVEIGMKLNLDDFLKNPKKLEKLIKMDVKYALLSSAIERYRKKPKILEAITEFTHYVQPEFAIYLLKMLRGTDDAMGRDYFKANIKKVKSFQKLCNNFGRFIVSE